MAEDLIELGIEGIDKLVDKHFHKLPDKYIDPHTYNLRRRLRHRDGDGEKSDEDEDVLRDDHEDSMRTIKGEKNSSVHRDVAYSTERRESYNPHQRQTANWPPSPSAYDSSRGYEYAVPPSTPGLGPQDNRGRRRREGLIRRSSSQPGSRMDNDREKTREDREREKRRRGKSFSHERRHDIVGAGRGNENEEGKSKTEKVVLTLLGAAVVGLAASAVIDRIDRKSGRGDDGVRIGGRARTAGGGRGDRDEKRVGKGGGRR